MKRLTPADLVNPKRASGYNGVATHPSWRTADGDTFRAQGGNRRRPSGSSGPDWYGPSRHTAPEAAQDYCDWYNTNGRSSTAITRTYSDPSVDMGNTTRHAPKLPPVKVVKPVFKGKHDLYDVYLYDARSGLVFRRKVGITARGHKRYEDIAKTFGFSIRPVCDAVTYPTKAAAERAERVKVAEVAKDPKWVRVAKEAFAPTDAALTVREAA